MAGLCRPKPFFAGFFHRRAAAAPLLHLVRLAVTRPYLTSGTVAAQPQLDPDYLYCYDSQRIENDSPPHLVPPSSTEMTDSEGAVPLRGVQWVFLGNPVAKKHVYADKLSKLLKVPHISMGSLVRQDLSPRSYLYKQIANAVNQGTLVPEDIIFGLLSKRLEDGYYRGETGFILGGIPRTRIQAEILDQLIDIDLVVNFKCTEDYMLDHYGKSLYSHCHESLGMGSSASTKLVMASEHTQSKVTTSDNEHAWKENFYAKQIEPLEDYYKKQKKLLDFQVGSASGETWQGLLAALDLQHINAFPSKLPP